MSNFARKTKQRIIDDYLQVTGFNMFKADEFVDWLANQPEHEMYDAFYGIDDATAARQWRIDMARRMASGRATVWNRRVRSSHPKLTPTIHLMRGEQLTSGASHGPCHTSS